MRKSWGKRSWNDLFEYEIFNIPVMFFIWVEIRTLSATLHLSVIMS